MRSMVTVLLLGMSVRGAPIECVNPPPRAIAVAINEYVNDILQVNGVIDSTDLRPDFGLQPESDEILQLNRLGTICGDATYTANIRRVNQTTQQVLGAIANIIDGVTPLSQAMSTINQARCCIILPNLDDIFQFATLAVDPQGVETTIAPRPNICQPTITSCNTGSSLTTRADRYAEQLLGSSSHRNPRVSIPRY